MQEVIQWLSDRQGIVTVTRLNEGIYIVLIDEKLLLPTSFTLEELEILGANLMRMRPS